MDTFVGINMVQAQQMKYEQFKARQNTQVISNDSDGYLVQFSNGEEHWLSKKDFEHVYFPLSNADSITKTEIDNFMSLSKVKTMKISNKTTIVKVVLPTSFEEVESSSCVDPNNFNQDVGTRIALNKLVNKLGSKLGFILQWARNGIDNNNKCK